MILWRMCRRLTNLLAIGEDGSRGTVNGCSTGRCGVRLIACNGEWCCGIGGGSGRAIAVAAIAPCGDRGVGRVVAAIDQKGLDITGYRDGARVLIVACTRH